MHFAYLFLFIFILSSCKQEIIETDNSSGDYCTNAGLATGSESSQCTTDYNYASPAVVSGTATFYKRDINVTLGLGPRVTNMELGAPISSPIPIKYAEIKVTNSAGSIVQCGKTNATGQLKGTDGTSNLELPNTSGTYTIEVLARANHNVSVGGGKPAFKFNAAVKSVCSNDVHSITSSVSVSGTAVYNTSLTAYARESQSSTIEGGAFNIYNNLAVSYDYLAANTASSDLSCLDSKLSVYWDAGFNPAQLIYPNANASDLSNISFYLRGYNELYINGGKLGNVTSADTDHFDDAVIIHELGHRIEDVCGKMDSPGGSHFGQFRIDPRLAWSEGWGNFLGAHIIRNNLSSLNPGLVTDLASTDGWRYYLDTEGYTDGANNAGSELIRFTLNRDAFVTSGDEVFTDGTSYDSVSSTAYPGEGHFREVSIARSLFKNTNTCTTNCINTNYFDRFWRAFEKISSGIGMGKSQYYFRSSARFYERLEAVFAGTLPTAVSSTITAEAQQMYDSTAYTQGSSPVYKTWVPYGVPLISNGGTPCYLKIQPREEYETITNQESDQRYSSHFYYFNRSTLPSVNTIKLTATKESGDNIDLDLILYQDGYTFVVDSGSKNTSSSQFVKADRSIATNVSGTYEKSITGLTSLSSANAYLLNVRAFTENKTISDSTAYTYTLTDNAGNYLCPNSDF